MYGREITKRQLGMNGDSAWGEGYLPDTKRNKLAPSSIGPCGTHYSCRIPPATSSDVEILNDASYEMDICSEDTAIKQSQTNCKLLLPEMIILLSLS
jgi:hypothetical protein